MPLFVSIYSKKNNISREVAQATSSVFQNVRSCHHRSHLLLNLGHQTQSSETLILIAVGERTDSQSDVR